MKRLAALFALIASLAVAILISDPHLLAQSGRSGVVEVRVIDVATRMKDGSIVARFHLASGLAVTQEIKNNQAAEALLRMADTFSAGRTRMLVELEDGKVEAVHVEVSR